MADGALAYVYEQFVSSFGIKGGFWRGLTIAINKPFAITALGFIDEFTFYLEFTPGGLGYIVTSSSSLDFSNATEISPIREPQSTDDNRFEFEVAGDRGFFRVEKR